jgi:hypothetical protein
MVRRRGLVRQPRVRVYPYKQGSRSAAALAEGLGGRVLKLEGSRFVKRPGDLIINWGNSNPHPGADFNGDRTALRTASNKRDFFVALGATELVPRHWLDRGDIPDDCFPVVCRTVLNGHSGDGIVIATDRDGIVAAPLYVQYVKKSKEFRIHVGVRNGEASIISEQQKVRRQGVEPTNWQVRNLANGFVFQRNGIEVPEVVRQVARDTLLAVEGLTFGAVDVIFNERANRAYALEINTAPGLEGTTVDDYVTFFRGP